MKENVDIGENIQGKIWTQSKLKSPLFGSREKGNGNHDEEKTFVFPLILMAHKKP
jgi:hypothetical protein